MVVLFITHCDDTRAVKRTEQSGNKHEDRLTEGDAEVHDDSQTKATASQTRFLTYQATDRQTDRHHDRQTCTDPHSMHRPSLYALIQSATDQRQRKKVQ